MEKETVDMCTNFSVFLQDEKETVDMCTNFIVFFSGGEVIVTLFLQVEYKILQFFRKST